MLQKKEERELEQQILTMADLLIENTIATSMLVGDAQERQLEKSIETVVEMAGLLEQYLGGHAEHLETLLQQLTQQKLPDENVLESFGDFRSHLDTAIHKGLALYQGQPEEETTSFEQENTEFMTDKTNSLEDEDVSLTESQATEEAKEASSLVDMENSASVTDIDGNWEINPIEEEQIVVSEEKTRAVSETSKSEPEKLSALEFPESEEGETIEETVSRDVFSSLVDKTDEEYGDLPEEVEEIEDSGQDNDISQSNNQQEQWDLALKHVFPGMIINKEYSIKGFTFSYFLPDLSLAIDTTPSDKREAVWKEYYCRKEKISLLSITANEETRYRQLARTIKRSLAQNAGHNYV